MKVLNMTLELVFLTELPTGGRRKLMEHCRNHRKMVREARQTIVGTALSEIHMSAAPPRGIFDCFSLGAHAIQPQTWTETRGHFLIEVV
jgi:hypothetical protein